MRDDGDWINIVVFGDVVFESIDVLIIDFVDNDIAQELCGNNVCVVNVRANVVVAMGVCNDGSCDLSWNGCCGSRINGRHKNSLIDWEELWISEDKRDVAKVVCWVVWNRGGGVFN